MRGNVLLHPHHVAPGAQLVAARLEASHHAVAHALVETYGSSLVGIGDAGFEIREALQARRLLERLVQKCSHMHAPCRAVHVDRGLGCPIVGLPGMKDTQVGIAERRAVFPAGDDVGIALQRGAYAFGEFCHIRHVVLEGDESVAHVGRVNGKQGGCVLCASHAKCDAHGAPLPVVVVADMVRLVVACVPYIHEFATQMRLTCTQTILLASHVGRGAL